MNGGALFDEFAKSSVRSAAPDAANVYVGFCRQLIESTLDGLIRVKAYVDQLSATSSREELGTLRVIWQLFADWADDADKVYDRVRQVIPSESELTPQLQQLADAIGRTRARLSVSPEATARAYQDIKAGRTLPIGAARDELRARTRA